MNKKFKRLTFKDRELIGRLLVQGLSQIQIAKLIGVHRSTICRELKRNSEGRLGYIIYLAQNRTEERRARYKPKIEKNEFVSKYILEKLQLSWSPEQIAGRLNFTLNKTIISHETIYSYIYSSAGIKNKLYKHLKTRRKQRFPKIARRHNKRTLIPNRISIHERPQHINNRDEFGHWEADLIVFSQDRKANIFTMRERKSRYLVAIKNHNRAH